MTPKLTQFCIVGLGTSAGYLWWYGFHVPSVRKRDLFYQKLEDQRAEDLKG